MIPGQPGSVAAATPAGFQPRVNAYGQPTQSLDFGKCKFPGCTFPKRIEGTTVHDFCSKTCAMKFSQFQLQGGHLFNIRNPY